MEGVSVPGAVALGLSVLHAVQDQLQLSAIRLDAMAMGRAHGLDTEAGDRLGIVVTEMAGNIARHAGSGQIILRPVGEHSTGCIEVLALDKGPGIADMTRAMRTPAGGVRLDTGLGSIRHLADLFDIYSHPGCGTAVMALVGTRIAQSSASPYAESEMHSPVGVVCVPLHGEEKCGDAWAVEITLGRLTALIVDGLGHGPEAAIAAGAAMAVFRDMAGEAPDILLSAMHAALRNTRGAALSVTVVDRSRHTVSFCGLGNVDGRIVTADTNQHLVPQNGIVGHTMLRALSTDTPWPTGGRLVMHSDGISSRWRAGQYPGLLARHPALLAGVLFRDFARVHDDATVLVIRDVARATVA